jgi:hypothetical protein
MGFFCKTRLPALAKVDPRCRHREMEPALSGGRTFGVFFQALAFYRQEKVSSQRIVRHPQ